MQGNHARELEQALQLEAEGQRALLAGQPSRAQPLLAAAAARYRSSWELASPTSYGRLIGMLKAAILAGGGEPEARYALEQLAGLAATERTPAAAYALALAELVVGGYDRALELAAEVVAGGPAFARAGAAIAAIAEADRERFASALKAIVADFESRPAHLTGVAIADTALMLQRLGSRRGLAVRLSGPLVGPPAD